MSTLITLFIILSVLCLGYYLASALYAGFGSSFLPFWLFMAFIFLLFAIILICHSRYQILNYIPKIIRTVVIILLVTGTLFFGVMEGLVISGMNDTADGQVEYVIVLGAQVRGTRITKMLARRIDAAEEYLNEYPDCKVICTGGQGIGEDISEAEAIKGKLIENGIDEDRILIEDESASTNENLKFSLELINDKDAKIAVVTNNYHVYRGKLLAKHVGFTNVQGIAGESEPILFLNYLVREGFALAKEIIFR